MKMVMKPGFINNICLVIDVDIEMKRGISSVKHAFKENEEITFVHIEGNRPDEESTILVDKRRLHTMINEKYHFQSKMNDFAEFRMLKMLWANVRETDDEDLKAILFDKIDDCKRVMGLY